MDYIEEIRKAAQCDAVKLHSQDIFARDYSFLQRESFSDEERAAIELVRECFYNVSPALMADCHDHPKKIVRLMTALRNGCEKEPDILQVRRSELLKHVSWLPEGRKEKQVYYFIRTYAGEKESGQLLYQYCDGPGMDFCDFVEALDVSDEQAYETAVAFLNWSDFDLSYRAGEIIQRVFRTSRKRDMMNMRADNISAKETAEYFHIRTSSVLVSERHAKRLLYGYFVRAWNMMGKICADRDGDPVISVQTLETYFGDYAPGLAYLLKSLLKDKERDCQTYAFDEYLDAFVPGNTVPSEFIRSQMKNLAEILTDDEVETAEIEMSRELEMNPDYVRKIIFQLYSPKGRFYVKNGTSSSRLYLEVVKRHFPYGIRLYSNEDIDEVRRHMLEDFGIDLSSRKNTSLAGGLRNCCIPCGHGLYRAP